MNPVQRDLDEYTVGYLYRITREKVLYTATYICIFLLNLYPHFLAYFSGLEDLYQSTGSTQDSKLAIATVPVLGFQQDSCLLSVCH